MSNVKFSFEEKDVKEIPMVEIAYQILKQSGKMYHYNELVKMIADVKGITTEDIFDYLPQLYTDINIDGRFANLGHSEWGLKRWYPADEVDSLYFNRDDDEEDDDAIYDYDDDSNEKENDNNYDDDSLDEDDEEVYDEEDTNDDIDEEDDEDLEDEESDEEDDFDDDED